ncbi:MAG: hypothetical protein WD991_02480 [Candidatus Paceibacterota bacterium]
MSTASFVDIESFFSPRLRALHKAPVARGESMATWRENLRKLTGEHNHNGEDDIQIPETIPPSAFEFGFWNGMMVAAIFLVWTLLLLPFTWWSPALALILIPGTLGMMIQSIAVNIPDWYGALVFNQFSRRRRVIFQGFHWKLWCEKLEHPLHSLKREVTATIEAVFTTNDPAEKMRVKILVHARLDTRPRSKEDDALNFIRFVSIDSDSLEHILHSEVKKMFGQHYGDSEMEELGKLDEVQKAVENVAENEKKIHKLEKSFGVHIGIVLEESVPDDATIEMKRTPARAEGLVTAIKKMTDAGMDPEKARRAALLLDPNSDYTEQQNEYEFRAKIDAPDLKNLHDVNIFPPGLVGNEKKKGKK